MLKQAADPIIVDVDALLRAAAQSGRKVIDLARPSSWDAITVERCMEDMPEYSAISAWMRRRGPKG